MLPVRITLKNYRSFDEGSKATFSLEKRVIAIVGANNSGKSSFLRFLHEFWSFWLVLSRAADLTTMFKNGYIEQQVRGVSEALTIFNRRNERDLSIEFEFLNATRPSTKACKRRVKTLTLTATRERPITASGTVVRFAVAMTFVPDPLPALVSGSSFQMSDTDTVIFAHEPQAPPTATISAGQMTTSRPYVPTVQAAHVPPPQPKVTPLVDLEDVIELGKTLYGCKYFPSFRNALSQGGGSDYDATLGGDLATKWADWKTGEIKQRLKIQEITERIRNLIGARDLEINANKEKRAFSLVVNKMPVDLNELGAGVAQLIVVLMNVALSSPSLILIDEPELSLHPSMQSAFVNHLASYGRGVMFATHSLGLARATAEQPIYSLRLENDRTVVRELNEMRNFAEFLGEMSFAEYNELGFEQLLLVEGVTDVRTMMSFLSVLGNTKRILILPLGGDGMVNGKRELELSEFTRILPSEKIAALVDSERSTLGGQPNDTRVQFEALCEKLKYKVHLTDYLCTEGYFTDRAVKLEMGVNAKAVGQFDKVNRNTHGWSKDDGFKIAQRMTAAEIENTDVGKFLKAL